MKFSKDHKNALKFTFLSSVGMCFVLLVLTTYSKQDIDKKKEMISNFNFSKISRAPKKNITKRKKKIRKKMRNQLIDLKPILGQILPGSSFGLNIAQEISNSLDQDLLKINDDIIMDEDLVDSPPKVITRSTIEFPEKALRAKVFSGSVELRMLIDNHGKVTKTELIAAKPAGYFEDVALMLVEGWLFRPATYQGKKVAVWARQIIRFGE